LETLEVEGLIDSAWLAKHSYGDSRREMQAVMYYTGHSHQLVSALASTQDSQTPGLPERANSLVLYSHRIIVVIYIPCLSSDVTPDSVLRLGLWLGLRSNLKHALGLTHVLVQVLLVSQQQFEVNHVLVQEHTCNLAAVSFAVSLQD